VTLIAEPSTLAVEGLDIDFLPYTLNPIEIIYSHFRRKARVLCAHIAVDDAQLNKLYNVRSEVSVEIEKDMVKVGVDILDGWERVFLGHYHGEQKLNDRVEYIGSPLQLSFGEAFQKKHIVVMDSETLQTEYIENTFSPKHMIIKSDQIDEFDLNNNFVIIQVPSINSSDIIDMRKNILETKKVQHLEFKELKNRSEDINKEEIQGKFDIAKGDVLERYIVAVGNGGLDRDILLKIGKDICQGEQ
jgi:DNA repair exonuclease SbcCD nuclease subunit